MHERHIHVKSICFYLSVVRFKRPCENLAEEMGMASYLPIGTDG